MAVLLIKVRLTKLARYDQLLFVQGSMVEVPGSVGGC